MPAPLLLAGAALGAGKIGSSILDYMGSQGARRAQRKAQGLARQDLTGGYDQAQGFQQPIYDTALKSYTNLAGDVGAGRYNTQAPGQFQWDPQQVFQDPEYQASMRAGTEALNSGANAGSMLFSGQNAKDLTQFGQDTFARRSDALYNRGFNAQNMAFNQNLAANNQNYGMAHDLTQPLAGAAGNLSSLSMSRGQDLANNSLGTGQINARGINDAYGAIGGGLTDLAGLGADYALGRGAPGVAKPKQRLF